MRERSRADIYCFSALLCKADSKMHRILNLILVGEIVDTMSLLRPAVKARITPSVKRDGLEKGTFSEHCVTTHNGVNAVLDISNEIKAVVNSA